MRRTLLAFLAATLLVGCGGVSAGPTTPMPPDQADIVVRSGALEFDTDSIVAPAGRAFTILFVNESPVPHNIALYGDDSASATLFAGEIIGQGNVTYEIGPIPGGQYVFLCDLHPEMKGQLTVR